MPIFPDSGLILTAVSSTTNHIRESTILPFASACRIETNAEVKIHARFDKEYLEMSCDDGANTHTRVVIFNNRLYIRKHQDAGFTRVAAALALLHQSIVTAREPLPNVEFCMGLEDWGSRGKFSLDRAPQDEEMWLMPDYGWFSWPEHVGGYSDIRYRMEKIEQEFPWEKKTPRLLWRGSMAVGKADRESLMQAAAGHSWNDVKAVDWGHPDTAISMEEHCKWKFQGFPEGNTYSGRLRYLQNCKTVIVTHPPRWIQHWTHLYNADFNSPDQNIVIVPDPIGDAKGVIVHEGEKEMLDRTWERLPEVMDALLKNDEKAKSIAENQWNFFRNRYISPASAACYWRKAIKGFGSVRFPSLPSFIREMVKLIRVLFAPLCTGPEVHCRFERQGDIVRVVLAEGNAWAQWRRPSSEVPLLCIRASPATCLEELHALLSSIRFGSDPCV